MFSQSWLIFLSAGQLTIPALTLAIDVNVLLGSLKLNLSDELCLNQKLNLSSTKRKTPATVGWIHMINTRLWSFGERNGNPLQYSCLENPMDRSLAGYSPQSRTEWLIRTHNLWQREYGPHVTEWKEHSRRRDSPVLLEPEREPRAPYSNQLLFSQQWNDFSKEVPYRCSVCRVAYNMLNIL